MKILLLILVYHISFSFALECREVIPLSKVESVAKSYVGDITSVKLSMDKRESICVYRINGLNGYVVIDATTGELLKFSKRKSK